MKAALLREYHQPLELVERPRPEVAHPTDVLVRIGGAGVCATDLHAIEGLMEPAGVTLPRVLGHENAGWVEEVGDGGHDRARRATRCSSTRPTAAASVSPAVAATTCTARGTSSPGLSVDGGFAEYVARLGALAAAAARRGRAGRRRAARGRRPDRLPRGPAARASRRARHDRGRDRCRRRRAHRAPARARARGRARSSRSTPTSGAGGSRRSSAPTRWSRSEP